MPDYRFREIRVKQGWSGKTTIGGRYLITFIAAYFIHVSLKTLSRGVGNASREIFPLSTGHIVSFQKTWKSELACYWGLA
jgi:hypothetical protein